MFLTRISIDFSTVPLKIQNRIIYRPSDFDFLRFCFMNISFAFWKDVGFSTLGLVDGIETLDGCDVGFIDVREL